MSRGAWCDGSSAREVLRNTQASPTSTTCDHSRAAERCPSPVNLAIAICVTRQHSAPTPGRTGREAAQGMGVQCQNPWRDPDRRASGRVLLFESDGHLAVMLLAISYPVDSLPPTHVPPFRLVDASSRPTFTFWLFSFFFPLLVPSFVSICFS